MFLNVRQMVKIDSVPLFFSQFNERCDDEHPLPVITHSVISCHLSVFLRETTLAVLN